MIDPAMYRARRVTFGFDERSFAPLEKLAAQGRIPAADWDEIVVLDPRTGEKRVLIVPRPGTSVPRQCPRCGQDLSAGGGQ